MGTARFATRKQARHEVAAWLDEYNTVRRHSTNGMLSPIDYERTQAATEPTPTDEPTAPPKRKAA